MKSKSNINPFNRNRAEQMGDETWKYYVEVTSSSLLSEKPLIFEGSRGCGKTMFFLCNSWKEKFLQLEDQSADVRSLFGNGNIIGFYYKVDGKFVGRNLSGKGVEEWVWQSVFNTYFNLIICKEIFLFLSYCIEKDILLNGVLHNLLLRINQKIGGSDTTLSIDKVINSFEKILDSIELYSNDPEQPKPIGLNAGTLINVLVEEMRKIEHFKTSRFHVFIDEFEELNSVQQKQINTLIKQSRYWLVFDIGVKSKGRFTEETMSGEIIQEPDDFHHHYPESDSFNRQDDYEELLFSICKKRLQDFIPNHYSEREDFFNIRYYLHYYGKQIELDEFASKPKFIKIKDILKQEIDSQNAKYGIYNQIELKDVYTVLIEQTPDIVRMHISLLKRSDNNLKTIYENAKKNSSKYKDWKHNMLFATYFLLCKELDVIKKYHGLKTFSMLSSGVIRSFLEICESAFDFAFNNGFTFESPRQLTLEEQTQAAHYVSQSKVAKIDGFVPDGVYLKRLILALGKLFYLRHTDPAATLGEPEPNHFFTNPSELKSQSNNAARILEHAVMHNVLQCDVPTKGKNDNIEITDYHFNHIFCPYFKISHRRKRKIFIDPKYLEIILIGSNSEVEKALKSLSNQPIEVKQGTLNFFGNDLSREI